jgi:conjugal transfer mating pair stabilization protein TraN
MYLWRTFTTVALLMLSVMSTAVDWQCAIDLDGDQALTSEGEIAACVDTQAGPLCPLDAVPCTSDPVCPLDAERGCVAGECSVAGTCTQISGIFGGLYECSTGGLYFGHANCAESCTQTASCQSGSPTCPLEGGTCQGGLDGSFTCSAQTCIDADAHPITVTDIDSRVYQDDGQRDDAGVCLDQVMLYSGRTMECRLSGKSTAYQSCCRGFDEIMTDSTGSIAEMSATGSAISATYAATKAAFDAYEAGSSIAESADSFNSVFTQSFDPATLAISIAISVAIDYFVNNCNAMDMETGIMNASGMCYETGTYCKSEWLGSCVQEAKTYCCFNSKLGRILHEQGRSQLISFLEVPPTYCRGFFPEEFQYLDFSKIDLSEYYGDLPTMPQSQIETNLDDKVHSVINDLQ